MPDSPLEERLAAVERALGDEEVDAPDPDGEPLSARVAALEEDVAELEAAVQAVRGYVGGVKHVNEEVERRADAAMATAQAVERALEAEDGRAHRHVTAATGSPTDAEPPVEATSPHSDDATRPCPHCGSDAGNPRDERGDSGREDDRPAGAPDRGREGPVPDARRGPRPVGQRQVGDGDADETGGLLDRVREVL